MRGNSSAPPRRDRLARSPHAELIPIPRPITGYPCVQTICPPTTLAVVVDRGWIFAGDVTESNGRIHIRRAVWVFRWESVGFAKVIEDPSNADIRKIADVDIPVGSEIFRIPVADEWGM